MSWILDKIKEFNEKNAIIHNENFYTYSQLLEQINFYYKTVSKEINKGEVIAILSDYSFYSVALFFAIYENKNIIVPVTSKIKSEIDERLIESGCTYKIILNTNEIQIDKIDFIVSNHPIIENLVSESLAGLILFSSGSTGKPKAMIHDLDNLIDSYRDKKSKKLIFLIFLMFDHIGGLNTMFNCISMGVTMVFPTRREPEYICSLIAKYKINILPASPTFLNLILISEAYNKYNLSSIRMITYGTETMPESLLLKLKNVFSRVKFLQTFGTSETGIMQITSKSSTSTSIKIDDQNTEYKIVNNELWIRSKIQILGYLNSSMDKFTEDGWFKTGDLVEKSDDGYIKIVGRNKELINVGGEKVLPSEVESVLLQMPLVKDCTVFGEPNPITGQIVAANLFLSENMKQSEIKKEVQKFCSDKLDKYKIPIRIKVIDGSEFTDRFKKKRN